MLAFYLVQPWSLAYKTRGKPRKEARSRVCATKDGRKGSTQMIMAVYATENDIEVVVTVSGQHNRKTPDFCEAYSQTAENARILLVIIKPD